MRHTPSGWRWSTVAGVGRVELGRQRHPDWHTGPNMRPYLRVANVFEDRIDTSDLKEMDFTGVFERFKLHPGDVLLNEGQTPELLGRPAIYRGVPDEIAFTNSLIRFKAGPSVCPEWALLVFRHHMHSGRFKRESRITTNIAHLSATRLKTVEFPVPPMQEQRRIVEILEEHLSHLDAAAGYEAAALKRASSLREDLVRRSITGADVAGRRELPDVADAGTQDGVLAPLPEGWAWRRLGDIADVVGGVTKDSKKQSIPGMVEVPYLRVANVQRGALKLDEVASIWVSPQKAEALKLRVGDVLLNEGGDRDKLARGWVWEEEVPNCIHQNHVFRARLRIDLDPYFLSFTANTLGGRWAERNGKQSVNLASISVSMIRRMPVIVPPKGASAGIVSELRDRLEELDRLDGAVRQSQGRTAGLRRAILAAAFEGKLTGRHTDSEVIEELAQR